MPKPSERILELRKTIAQERLVTTKAAPSFDFISKVSGTTDEDVLRNLEFDEGTTPAAILTYLDEAAEARNA